MARRATEPVAGLAANQDVQQGRGHVRGHVGDHDEGRAIPHAGQPRHGVGQDGDSRKEAERLRPHGAVPHPCDGLVEPRIPAEEPLVHPGGDANVGRVRAIHDEMRQCEDTEHNHPGQHEGQERLACGLDQPSCERLSGGRSERGRAGRRLFARARAGRRVRNALRVRVRLHQPGCGAYSVRVIGS